MFDCHTLPAEIYAELGIALHWWMHSALRRCCHSSTGSPCSPACHNHKKESPGASRDSLLPKKPPCRIKGVPYCKGIQYASGDSPPKMWGFPARARAKGQALSVVFRTSPSFRAGSPCFSLGSPSSPACQSTIGGIPVLRDSHTCKVGLPSHWGLPAHRPCCRGQAPLVVKGVPLFLGGLPLFREGIPY